MKMLVTIAGLLLLVSVGACDTSKMGSPSLHGSHFKATDSVRKDSQAKPGRKSVISKKITNNSNEMKK